MLKIKELLARHGKSQRWLARETGINVSTINSMVNGQRTYLNVKEEEKIAEALGVNPKELYYQGRNQS
ncbi:helix-turn-helix domain-containing protein [Sporomusa sphaeroides]|uniref:helix-turn-helix domain-containing protein n=1 Tax=Sporomusa sphaeroides TaxID=47679 RepID=UPI002C976194|nr:helix-turn-helix transcriptional regulator [Sporomusa sphaeroides]HML33799.1 helix-turn-helix transcriptional regulator [Sporomusa sphaeroides]